MPDSVRVHLYKKSAQDVLLFTPTAITATNPARKYITPYTDNYEEPLRIPACFVSS